MGGLTSLILRILTECLGSSQYYISVTGFFFYYYVLNVFGYSCILSRLKKSMVWPVYLLRHNICLLNHKRGLVA